MTRPRRSFSLLLFCVGILVLLAVVVFVDNYASKAEATSITPSKYTQLVTATDTPTSTPTPFCNGANLDPTFNGTGVVITSIDNGEGARSVAVQTDGKVVAVGRSFIGSNNVFAVVRYNTDGSLDTSFGGTGIVTTPVGSFDDTAYGVAIQSDGRIVTAGQSSNGSNFDFAVVRYNSDGSLDTSFGGTGKVTTAINSLDDSAYAVAVQSNGNIAVAGESNNGTTIDFAVVRYTPNGSLDTTLNGTGMVTTAVGDGHARSIAIQSDNRMVVAGFSDFKFTVIRYNVDGTLDNAFNGNGKVITQIASFEDLFYSTAIQADGKIVTAGGALGVGGALSFAVVRLNANGTFDPSFNGSGRVITNIGYSDRAYSVAIQPDGKIVAAGASRQTPLSDNRFGVIRFNSDGSLDTTFNGTGKVVTPGTSQAFSIAIQPDQKIVAAGNGSSFTLVRFKGSSLTCPPISVSGNITYGNPTGTPTPRFISNVTVNGIGSPNVSTTSDAIGNYMLSDFGPGAYTVSLSKTTGVNGINSFDAGRVAQHVAGTFLLSTNNQKVSADVTNNNQITSQDAAKIAQFVASLPVSPPNLSGTWKFFVSPGPTFPIGSSPMTRTYSSVTSNVTGDDYVGLLLGEVTGNWTASATRLKNNAGAAESDLSVKGKVGAIPPIDGRSMQGSGPERGVTVELTNLEAITGKDITLPVNVYGVAGKGIISYEFDLRYDPTVIQPINDVADVKGTASRGLSVVVNPNEPGLLRVVVYGAYPIDKDGVLLNLRFTAVGSAGSVSPLTFERIMFNDGEPKVSVADGRVELF